jgi:hypothetical protein
MAHRTLNKGDYKLYVEKAISYTAYMDGFEKMAEKLKIGEPVNYPHTEYVQLNLQRARRVAKTVSLVPEISEGLKALRHKTTWLILSEYWCGDAAQNLPVLEAVADKSEGQIEIKILMRDENTDLMDLYLTNGGRAIPKLIQLDAHCHVTGIWGPRPTELQKLAAEWKKNPDLAATYKEDIQRWYIKDNSKTMQHDVVSLIQRAMAFCIDCMI